MSVEVFELRSPGLGATIQDRGRWGWRRFGVPGGGAMDDHAARWANRLLDNPPDAPLLELLLQGAQLRARSDGWIAVTGAETEGNVAPWHAARVAAGDTLHFTTNRSGVWSYVAVPGGFEAPRWLGSASVYPRGGLGRALAAGDVLRAAAPAKPFAPPHEVAGRLADWRARRVYATPPPLRVWRGPQWESFSDSARAAFFDQPWTVSPQSDRVGYRLSGRPLAADLPPLISEPVRVGSIQVPPGGQPIVTMRDGPTVGGYPKLGMVDGADLSWLVQCKPGTHVRFTPVE